MDGPKRHPDTGIRVRADGLYAITSDAEYFAAQWRVLQHNLQAVKEQRAHSREQYRRDNRSRGFYRTT